MLAENQLDPQGRDVWLRCVADDRAASSLAGALAAALDISAGPDEVVDAVADALLAQAPAPVALVLDDVHLVPDGSEGAELLLAVLDRLPANGHLVLAGRRKPPLPLARLVAQGEALVVREDDLAFTPEELEEFARLRGVDRIELAPWPALAEIMATAGPDVVRDFLWEEVVAALPEGRRRDLAVLAAVGGGDRALVEAATGEPADLDDLAAEVPLLTVTAGGWVEPHALWDEHLGAELTPEERRTAQRRAAAHLLDRGDRTKAFPLLAAADAGDELRSLVLEVATHVYLPVAPDVLGGWSEALAGDDLVLRALLAKERDGELAAAQALLEQARDDARAGDDPAGELACLVHLFSIGWSQDDAGLLASAITRAIELGAEGYAPAGPIAAIGQAGLADFGGDVEGALAVLDAAPIQPTDDWDAIRTWMRADLLEASGHPAAALDALDRGRRDAVGLIRDQLNGARIQALWSLGRIDEAVAVGEDALSRASTTASARTAQRAHAMAARFAAHIGDLDLADEHLRMVDQYPPADRVIERRRAVARATRAVAVGDEDAARAELAWVTEEAQTVFLAARKTVLRVLPLVYVLLPQVRATIDGLDVGPSIAVSRTLSRALVAAREGDLDPLAALPTPPPGILRAALPVPWLVELAAALDALGRPDGRQLLAELGADAHPILARLAERDAAAKRLLAEVPRPPAHPVELRLLGAPELVRGGEVVTDAAWRRDRVRQLLAHLVLHGSTTRDAVADALWPDLDVEAASNNLRGTLSHLLRLLQPDRQGREPSYFVRQVDRSLVLTGVDRLRVDVWELEAHLDAAAAAERDGATRTALAAYREAVGLWRGPLGGDAPWGWMEDRAEQLAHRVLTATGRAAELTLASGELDEAEDLAGRVLALDQWSERAYRVLASAQLARGERDAARRTLSRCRAALAELGVEPDPATEMVERRLA